MTTWTVGIAPAALDDIERIYRDLVRRTAAGEIPTDYPDRWLGDLEEGIRGLGQFAQRHAYAPERDAWGGPLRNVLLRSGYRILYTAEDRRVWVLRVRHQRQQQLDAGTVE